ncbi:MAG: hypothetical protein ACE5EL_00535 [Anaerolineae bacterium]
MDMNTGQGRRRAAVAVAGGVFLMASMLACRGSASQGDAPEPAAATIASPRGDAGDLTPGLPGTARPVPADEGASDVSGASSDAEGGQGAAGPLTDDMLSAAEARRATDMALAAASGMLAAATDRDALGASADLGALAASPSFRVMYAERHAAKEAEGRRADVAFYRYDTNEVVLTMVDLQDGMVTPLAVPPGYMPPLLPSEIREAERVAMADGAVEAALAAAGLDPTTATANGLLTSTTDESASPCRASRCVRLWFFDPSRIVPTFNVIVDLTSLKVAEIVPFEEPEEENQ